MNQEEINIALPGQILPVVVHPNAVAEKLEIKGFTLIELIVYVALFAIFITGAILFSFDVIYGREKSFNQQIVQQNARIALSRITYEVSRAQDIQSLSPTQLILTNGVSQTTISLEGQTIRFSSGGLGPYDLTSNQVAVTNLLFTDLTSPGNDAKSVSITLTLRQAEPAASGQLTAETQISQSVELNSQFNQARRLLLDLTGLNLVGGTSLEGITIQNSADQDITIDRMYFSWTGTAGGEQVTGIQIGAGPVEWTGTSASGSTIDLTDFGLSAGGGVYNIDYITFDSSMEGATLNMNFILSDGSTLITNLTLLSGGTPTPSPIATPTPTSTPSPTPTPSANSCNSICILNGYTSGICRKNAASCTGGEVYYSPGDVYCTGGPTADTCCCIP